MPYLGCYELIQVSTDSLKEYNRAWTNRVWEDYPYSNAYETTTSGSFTDDSLPFAYGTDDTPTNNGRALFEEYYGKSGAYWYLENFEEDTFPMPVLGCDLTSTVPGAVGIATTPLGNCTTLYDYPRANTYVASDGDSILIDGDNPSYLALPYEDLERDPDEEDAISGSVSPDSYDDFGNSDRGSPAAIAELLVQLYAKTYGSFTYDWNAGDSGGGAYIVGDPPDYDFGGYSGATNAAGEYDVTSIGDTNGTGENSGDIEPPQIASVGECFGTQCVEGSRGAFSVNDTDTGNVVGDNGAKHVNVKFFGWADSNQMPLKNVIVDWGDSRRADPYQDWAWPPTEQTGSTDDQNFYKNHRGMDQEANGTLSGMCDDEDEWGLQAATCETAYFNFTHDYVCSTGLVATLPTCELADDGTDRLLNSPCTGGDAGIDATSACVFQPRVHLKDNWGWCTGFCDTAAGDDGTDGCYSGDNRDECDVTQCPSENIDGVGTESAVCPDTYASGTNNPWINFDGYVIVQP